MLREQQTANAFSKLRAHPGIKIENSGHTGTAPQNLFLPVLGTLWGRGGGVVLALFLKKQLLYLTMELSFP